MLRIIQYREFFYNLLERTKYKSKLPIFTNQITNNNVNNVNVFTCIQANIKFMLQVLIKTFLASFAGLGMFMLTLSVCVMIYSSILYYAEQNVPESTIHSIPEAFWWAIITMTTVGYGDSVPVGLLGRIVGTACAVSGILTLAIPVPIIAGHFNRFYSSMTGRHHHTL